MKELIDKIERGEQALSFTALSRFMKSPAEFVRYKTEEYQRTPAMIEGSAAHALVLEPEKYHTQYYSGKIKPDDERQRLTDTQFKNAQAMAKNVLNHHKYKNIRQTARRVETHETIELDGYKIRRVLDIDAFDAVYDVKTMGAADITPKKFKWKIYDFKYHVQAAIYVAQYPTITENIQHIDFLPEFYWIAVTKNDCVIMRCSKELIVAGFHRLQQAFHDWQRCIAADAWKMGSEFYLSPDELIIQP